MAAGWPFFAALLGNMEMVLAKSDMGIAARYAELAADIDGHDAIFARIQGGWNRAHDGLLAITGQTRLLEDRKRDVWGTGGSVRVALGGCRIIKQTNKKHMKTNNKGLQDI